MPLIYKWWRSLLFPSRKLHRLSLSPKTIFLYDIQSCNSCSSNKLWKLHYTEVFGLVSSSSNRHFLKKNNLHPQICVCLCFYQNVWCLMCDLWCLFDFVFICLIVDCWCLICYCWLLIFYFDVWFVILIFDVWFLIDDFWLLMFDCWFLIVDVWLLIFDFWFLILTLGPFTALPSPGAL